MADRYERIRAALGMNLTPGPWTVANTNNGMFIKSLSVPGYLAEVRHCRTMQDHKADAAFIAACDPDTIRELIDERDALKTENEKLREALTNARLIAAAPELLAALEGMEKWASSIHDGYPPSTASIAAAPYREAARAAIASVKGPK